MTYFYTFPSIHFMLLLITEIPFSVRSIAITKFWAGFLGSSPTSKWNSAWKCFSPLEPPTLTELLDWLPRQFRPRTTNYAKQLAVMPLSQWVIWILPICSGQWSILGAWMWAIPWQWLSIRLESTNSACREVIEVGTELLAFVLFWVQNSSRGWLASLNT